MNYPIYEINGVKTYRTPQHLRTLRDVACRQCAKELTEVGEMDEYQLCHYCYCKIMDTNTTKLKEGK